MCPSLAATKQTRPPLKNVPFSEPNAESAAATDMIQPQLPSTLFLWGEKNQLLRRNTTASVLKWQKIQKYFMCYEYNMKRCYKYSDF